jgi:hypothetical protein
LLPRAEFSDLSHLEWTRCGQGHQRRKPVRLKGRQAEGARLPGNPEYHEKIPNPANFCNFGAFRCQNLRAFGADPRYFRCGNPRNVSFSRYPKVPLLVACSPHRHALGPRPLRSCQLPVPAEANPPLPAARGRPRLVSRCSTAASRFKPKYEKLSQRQVHPIARSKLLS